MNESEPSTLALDRSRQIDHVFRKQTKHEVNVRRFYIANLKAHERLLKSATVDWYPAFALKSASVDRHPAFALKGAAIDWDPSLALVGRSDDGVYSHCVLTRRVVKLEDL